MTQSAQRMNLNLEFIKFICYLFKRQVSNFYIIFGRRGTGKTDLSLLICEILHDCGIIKHFATNALIYDSHFPIKHVDNLDDLKYWAKENRGLKLFDFDEVATAIKRRSPMSRLNVDWLSEMQTIRKHKLSLLATAIDDEDTDKGILRHSVLDGVFTKPYVKAKSRKRKIAYFEDKLEDCSKPLRNLPKTSIKFDTWSSAVFKRHGEKQKPPISDEVEAKLWDYARGASYKTLGWHPQQLSRNLRKFVKEVLDRKYSQFTEH